MISTYKFLKRELRDARFITELKSLKRRIIAERLSHSLNHNQCRKLTESANEKIVFIAERHEERMARTS